MAIVQISRITNRKGFNENLPQLDGAEFGWCVDTRRLFIGNGTLQEGAPVIGNTEILTEFSDITVLSNYTYEDIAVGYAAQTGPTVGDPVVRSVQAKLDDTANVRDFGAVGDGVADDTEAINRALYQLYCRERNTQVRRSLYFPAGTYKVTNTIVIPTYAKLVGEGANCTIILLDTPTDVSTLPSYVARLGDSLQQTGVNIGSNGATPPRNIEISGMSFQTLEYNDVFLVEAANQCWFSCVDFRGAITEDMLLSSGFAPGSFDVAGVRFSSSPSTPCQNIVFDSCAFLNNTYGIRTSADVRSTTVSNSRFATLYQGIILTTAPTGFRIVHNSFDAIYGEGIITDGADLVASAYNIFYNVGNSIGSTNATSPVIRFSRDTNVSVGDMFERTDDQAVGEPTVYLPTSVNPSGNTGTTLGRFFQGGGKTLTLANNASLQPAFVVNSVYVKAFEFKYTVTRDVTVRHGTLQVVIGPSDDSTANSSYTEDYIENFDTGVTFGVSVSGGLVTVQYSTTNTGFPAILTYAVNHLA